MDKFLAELYGTGDLVKQAAAETEVPQELVDDFTEKVGSLCKSAGVDPANLSEKEVTEMWDGYVGAVQKQAAENPYTNMTKQAFDEADAMGRIMAHSYVNELNGIEKDAGAWADAAKRSAAKANPGAVKKTLGQIGGGIKGLWQSGKKGKALTVAGIGAPVAGAGGATAAALALKKHLKEKKSSLSEVIEKRAYDILAANGLVYQDGTPATPQEVQKLAEEAQEPEKKEEEKKEEEEKKDEEEKQALDSAALSYLSDLGYPVAE